jgi:hypothetical protein
VARIVGDERRERVRERVLQALVLGSVGEMTRTAIKVTASGGDATSMAEVDEALHDLERAGMAASREVKKVVGRFGRGSKLWRYQALSTALDDEHCDTFHMDLDPVARLALFELALGIVTLLAETA